MTIAQVTLMDGKVIPLMFDFAAIREFKQLSGQTPAEYLSSLDVDDEKDAAKVFDPVCIHAGIYCNLPNKSIYRKGKKLDNQLDPQQMETYMEQVIRGMIISLTGKDPGDMMEEAKREAEAKEDSSEGEAQAPSAGAS